jgi:hypothetical protein
MLVPLRGLDRASRGALHWMTIRLCALVLLWSFPWVIGKVSFEHVLVLLPPVFMISALAAMFAAALRRERIGAKNLNTWDEAVAFSGLAILVHTLHRFAY